MEAANEAIPVSVVLDLDGRAVNDAVEKDILGNDGPCDLMTSYSSLISHAMRIVEVMHQKGFSFTLTTENIKTTPDFLAYRAEFVFKPNGKQWGMAMAENPAAAISLAALSAIRNPGT